MRFDDFANQLEQARGRFLALQSQAGGEQTRQVIQETLTELSNSLEELRVAVEELGVQNEALTEARGAAERERRRYQELFHLAPDGYLVTDRAGNIEEANRAAGELLHIEPGTLVGKPLSVFVSDMDKREFRDQLAGLNDRGHVEGWELTIRTRDPVVIRHVVVSATTGHDASHDGPIIRWTLRDVTEQRRLQSQVREMDDKLWVRVVERTRMLTYENERLRAELHAAGAKADGAASEAGPRPA